LLHEAFHNCFEKRDENFAGGKEVKSEVRKWLREQSKVFYAAVFDELVKRWDKCIIVGRGYVKK
jgi:hypothetical protein